MVIVLEITIANVIEPLLFSHHTGVSPLALLVAALFWTWLWGPLGLVLSTPLTLCLVVLGQNAPRFRFLATLLGDRPVLSAHDRYYQRLLAVDEREAFAVASEHVTEHGPAATFDDVLLPALRHLRSDRERETVAAKEEAYVCDATVRAMDHIKAGSATPDHPLSLGTAVVGNAVVLGCPAHHHTEEIALEMIARLCPFTRVEVVTRQRLSEDIVSQIARERPALVLIAVMPPGGLTLAAFLCRRLRRDFPELVIVVAYLRPPKDFDRLLLRMRKAGASYLTTSLAQTASRVEALLAPIPAIAS
jgi:hypothetical protein